MNYIEVTPASFQAKHFLDYPSKKITGHGGCFGSGIIKLPPPLRFLHKALYAFALCSITICIFELTGMGWFNIILVCLGISTNYLEFYTIIWKKFT